MFQTNKLKFIFLLCLFSSSLLPNSVKTEPIIKCKSVTECRNILENAAKSFLGSRYSYGSSGGSHQFDCSGLVLTMISKLLDKASLPRTSQDMYRSLNQSVSLNDAHTGDLVFFNTGKGVSHVGMYWGKDAKGHHIMYHASTSKGVEMHQLDGDKYWMPRLVGIKRFSPISTALFSLNPFQENRDKKSNFPEFTPNTGNTKKPQEIELSNDKILNSKKKSFSYQDIYLLEDYISYEDDMYELSEGNDPKESSLNPLEEVINDSSEHESSHPPKLSSYDVNDDDYSEDSYYDEVIYN